MRPRLFVFPALLVVLDKLLIRCTAALVNQANTNQLCSRQCAYHADRAVSLVAGLHCVTTVLPGPSLRLVCTVAVVKPDNFRALVPPHALCAHTDSTRLRVGSLTAHCVHCGAMVMATAHLEEIVNARQVFLAKDVKYTIRALTITWSVSSHIRRLHVIFQFVRQAYCAIILVLWHSGTAPHRLCPHHPGYKAVQKLRRVSTLSYIMYATTASVSLRNERHSGLILRKTTSCRQQ